MRVIALNNALLISLGLGINNHVALDQSVNDHIVLCLAQGTGIPVLQNGLVVALGMGINRGLLVGGHL